MARTKQSGSKGGRATGKDAGGSARGAAARKRGRKAASSRKAGGSARSAAKTAGGRKTTSSKAGSAKPASRKTAGRKPASSRRGATKANETARATTRRASTSRGRSGGRPSRRSAPPRRGSSAARAGLGDYSGGTQRARWIESADQHAERPGQTLATRDHDAIMRWAEERGAVPATIAGTERDGRPGVLRFDFPAGGRGGGRLRQVDWDEWFETFDQRKLVFLFQEEMKSSRQSNFFRLDNPDREEG